MYPNSAMNVASEPTTTGVALGFRGRGRGGGREPAASGSLPARGGSVIGLLRAVVAAVVLVLVLATTAGGAAGARADRRAVGDGRRKRRRLDGRGLDHGRRGWRCSGCGCGSRHGRALRAPVVPCLHALDAVLDR